MESPRVRGQTRLWTDDEMLEMMEKINRGYTYHDVTDKTHVPISTLWTRVKGKYGGEVRPKTGAPCLFPSHIEEDIALFMKHCTFLQIPRMRQILRDDILHFVQYKEINVPRMAEDGPGRSFFDRFANDWSDFVKFYKIENDPISMKDWVFEQDHYTGIQVFSKHFSSRKYIFVAETDVLTIEASNKVTFTVVIVYNAEGEMLIPFVLHKVDFPDVLKKHFKGRINFFPTDDGNLDRNCMSILMYIINLFLINNYLKESPIIYLAPDLAKHINLFMWDIANNHNFVLQTIPKNIYRYFKTANMGVFEKVKPKFRELAKQKFPDKSDVCLKFHFLDILTSAMGAGKWNSHLRNSCRRLKIVHVAPEVPEEEEEVVQNSI